MLTRIIVGITGGFSIIAMIYFINPIFISIIMSIICAIAAFEFLYPTKALPNNKMVYIAMIIAVLFPICIYYKAIKFIPIIIIIAILYCFIEFIITKNKKSTNIKINHILMFLVASILIPVALSSLLQIFLLENGKILIAIPLVSAWSSDTMALFTGMFFGKHKLAPNISPKKTIEGSVGGIFGGIIGMIIFGFIVKTYFNFDISYISCTILGILGSVLGQIGDLSFSVIKRKYNIKDYGFIIPGHGGVLDRFDSVIFVAPIILLALLG